MVPSVPTFRTAREQMDAVFGTTREPELAECLAALALDPSRHRTKAAMLILEGGRDVLVPIGSQKSFFDLSTSDRRSVLTWGDGQHTIYNHAQERNDRVADWFSKQLGVTGS
jgi:esterase/lipase